MTYEVFKKVILERLSYDIADPKQISVQTHYKNNGCFLDSLVILEKGCNIAPALYLNRYYALYQGGRSFQEIYEQLLSFMRRTVLTLGSTPVFIPILPTSSQKSP